MDQKLSEMRHSLQAACVAGIISKPHLIQLPKVMPFRAAISSVALPDGCNAPSGPMPLRVGAGTGETEAEAAFLAMAEAAERFSLQYDPTRPGLLTPFLSVGGAPDPVPFAALTLGAPGQGMMDTCGAAAGRDRSDAASRALYEVLEHHHVRMDGTLIGMFHALPPGTGHSISQHIEFLADQLRVIDVAVMISPLGYVVTRALCHDADGGRCAMGSAAGPDLDHSLRRAAEEALLLWRNMVEMEARCVPIPAPSTRQGDLVRMYRGAKKLTYSIPDTTMSAPPTVTAPGKPLEQLVHEVTRQRVRVFDLTKPSLNVTVVRALLG